MNTPRYSTIAARLLAKQVPPGARPAGDAERQRGLSTIERALRRRAQRRVAWMAFGVGAAAAAAFVLAWRLPSSQQLPSHASVVARPARVAIEATPTGRGAALETNGRSEPLDTHSGLASGQRIDTAPDGGASLRLSTGTDMVLSGRTSFRVDSQGALQRFSVQRGEVAAHVAKLAPGHRFILATPDAEVEVRGTRFSVRVLEHGEACGGGSRTRLTVTEGVVEVRSAQQVKAVHAGEVWPSDCGTAHHQPPRAVPAPTPVASVGRHHQAAEPAEHAGSEAPRGAAAAPAAEASPLAAQNELFAEGVALRRQGDVGGALRAYQALITRFPSSPLAENAMVERLRLLASSRDPRAESEAQRYLTRYPRGFAAAEARQLVKAP